MGRPTLELGKHGSISATRRDDGVWIARCRYRDYDGQTRLVQAHGSSKTKASAALQTKLRDRHGAHTASELTAADRINKAADEWLRRLHASERRPTTIETYQRVLALYVRPALGELRIREMTVPAIERWLELLRAKGLSASTLRTARTVLAGIMQTAVRHGAVPANPVREIDRIEGGPRKPPRALTPPERTRLLTLLRSDHRAVEADLDDIALFMLGTGVRIGEALACRWCDLGVAEVPRPDATLLHIPIINVTGNVVRVKGMGLIRHDGKTATAKRAVPLPRFVLEMLQTRRPDADPGDLPIFPSRSLGYRDPTNTSRALRRVLRPTPAEIEAGASDEFAWLVSHVFRKTAATEWKRMGLNDQQIADLLGHAQVSMTQDVYFGRAQIHAEGATAMDEAFGFLDQDDYGTGELPGSSNDRGPDER